jgi:hypothetical protein
MLIIQKLNNEDFTCKYLRKYFDIIKNYENKKQEIDQEKIIAKHISDRGLVLKYTKNY